MRISLRLILITMIMIHQFGGAITTPHYSNDEIMCKIAEKSKWSNKSCSSFYCNWEGVICDENSEVVKLAIIDNILSGIFPSEIGLLQYLTSLNIVHSSLSGTIPTEIGLLSKLISLNLTYNSLFGPIPSEIGLLSNLRNLNLFQNSLNGTIPTEIGSIYFLKQLNLGKNNLTPSFSSDILHWFCSIPLLLVDFISDIDFTKYCDGTIRNFPFQIVGNVYFFELDASNVSLIFSDSNSHLYIDSNLTLNVNSNITLGSIYSFPMKYLISVGSCVHFDGNLILQRSITDVEIKLMKYQCHEGEFKKVIIEDRQKDIIIKTMWYSPTSLDFSLTCSSFELIRDYSVFAAGVTIGIVVFLLVGYMLLNDYFLTGCQSPK